jgi:YD repeat-containing protein
LSTGLFTYEQTDLTLPDVMPIALTRVFRQGYLSGPFGIGSTHPYEIYLVGTTNGYTYMDLIMPDAGRVHYTRTSAGTNWWDAVLEHNTTASSFYGSMISWNGNGWDFKFKNGTVYTFPESSGVPSGSHSAISRMKDRYGNAITMTRDPATGVLQKIITANGRWISFIYDQSNRITQAADNGGRTYAYQYDEGGRLVQVTNPLNGITQYTYDANNQMLTIVDPRGKTYLTNQYNSEGRISQQTVADGGVWQFTYIEDANGNITQTDSTNPRGFVKRLLFNSSGYFSGGLITSEIIALGTPQQQSVTYQYQPTTNLLLSKTDSLGRTTTYTYDTNGNPLSVTRLAGTLDAVTTTFAYDYVLNRPLSITDALGHTFTSVRQCRLRTLPD